MSCNVLPQMILPKDHQRSSLVLVHKELLVGIRQYSLLDYYSKRKFQRQHLLCSLPENILGNVL